MKKETKKAVKELAQWRLMRTMQNEIQFSSEKGSDESVREIMIIQFRRVEKMFGYDAGSWGTE